MNTSDQIACVKCGSTLGWNGPTYERPLWLTYGGYIPDRLLFRCVQCGYQRDEPTKDAPPKPLIDTTVFIDDGSDEEVSWFNIRRVWRALRVKS